MRWDTRNTWITSTSPPMSSLCLQCGQSKGYREQAMFATSVPRCGSPFRSPHGMKLHQLPVRPAMSPQKTCHHFTMVHMHRTVFGAPCITRHRHRLSVGCFTTVTACFKASTQTFFFHALVVVPSMPAQQSCKAAALSVPVNPYMTALQ